MTTISVLGEIPERKIVRVAVTVLGRKNGKLGQSVGFSKALQFKDIPIGKEDALAAMVWKLLTDVVSPQVAKEFRKVA